MASDNLNQVGKFLKNTRKDTDFALKRYHPGIPQIERTRDIFDPNIPFEMSFKTDRKESKVLLNLNFNKPPPLNECSTDCLQATCETFTVGPGNHYVTLANPYNVGTLTVFLDSVLLLADKYSETSPSSGEVYVEGTLTTDVITICYTYGTCPNALCPDQAVNGAYTGLAPIFMDRFDRAGHDSPSEPIGHCGKWFPADGTGRFIFEDGTVSGRQWETLVAFNYFEGADDRYALKSGVIGEVSIEITDTWIKVFGLFDAYQLDFANNPVLVGPIAGNSKTPHTMTTGSYYLRWAQITPGGWYVRIWSQGTVEPATWDAYLSTGNWETPADPIFIDISPCFIAIIGGDTGFDEMTAITVWGSITDGRFDAASSGIHSYSIDTCYPNPAPGWPATGELRFGHCEPSVVTTVSDPFDIGGSMANSGPGYAIYMSWPHFVPDYDGAGRVTNTHEHTASYAVPRGSGMRVQGKVAITGPSDFNDHFFNVSFVSYAYGDGPPSQVGTTFGGSGIGSVGVPVNKFVDFDIIVPVSNGRAQYGVRIPNPHGAAAELPFYHGSFLLPNNTQIGVVFSNVKISVEGAITCTTGQFCPDTQAFIDERCGEVIDTFNTPQAFNSNCHLQNFTFTSTNGKTVSGELGYAASLQLGGGLFHTTFKADGVTTDGSDGLCIRGSTDGANARSSTDGWVDLYEPTQFGDTYNQCTNIGEVYWEARMSGPAPNWVADHGPNIGATFQPEIDFFFGGTNSSPQINLIWTNAVQRLEVFNTTADTFTNAPTLIPHEWYSYRVVGNGSSFKFKMWRTSSPEPGAWIFDKVAALRPGLNRFLVEPGYFGYVNDDTYIDIANFYSTAGII